MEIVVRLRPPHDNMHALLLRSSAAALLLLASHNAPAATPTSSGVALIEGKSYPVCRAITAAVRRLGPHVGPTDWVTRLPPIRGVTQPTWTPIANAAAVPSDTPPHPGLIYGSPEEATIPGVVIETPPAMGTGKSVTIDLHLVRRAMRDDGTGQWSGIGGHPGQALGWSFEAVNFNLFPSAKHVEVGTRFVSFAVVLSGGQPWFGKVPGTLGTLEANPVLPASFSNRPGLLIRQQCFIWPGRP